MWRSAGFVNLETGPFTAITKVSIKTITCNFYKSNRWKTLETNQKFLFHRKQTVHSSSNNLKSIMTPPAEIIQENPTNFSIKEKACLIGSGNWFILKYFKH
jgi:hypothetical protein